MTETRIIAWPDTHVPEEDKKAVDVALQIKNWYKPHTVVILGDFLDCAPVSHWLKSRKQRKTMEGLRLASDFEKGNDLLDKITLGIEHLIYMEGNHCKWIRDAIDTNPEFDGLINLELGLKFKERRESIKLTHLEYGQCTNIGKLWFHHGIYTTQYHARKHVEAFERSIVYGHLHTVQTHVKVNATDVNDKHIGICLGCLCKKNPAYGENQPNAWVHCIGVGLVRADGTFNIDPIIINNGVASYAGITYRARACSPKSEKSSLIKKSSKASSAGRSKPTPLNS